MLTIGPHKVNCGSLTSPELDSMLAGERVDILYSDPPWGDGNLAYWQTMNRKMTGAETPQVKHDELYDRIMGLVRLEPDAKHSRGSDEGEGEGQKGSEAVEGVT